MWSCAFCYWHLDATLRTPTPTLQPQPEPQPAWSLAACSVPVQHPTHRLASHRFHPICSRIPGSSYSMLRRSHHSTQIWDYQTSHTRGGARQANAPIASNPLILVTQGRPRLDPGLLCLCLFFGQLDSQKTHTETATSLSSPSMWRGLTVPLSPALMAPRVALPGPLLRDGCIGRRLWAKSAWGLLCTEPPGKLMEEPLQMVGPPGSILS